MPDKQNDNKFMAMLERRGIVRKADSEDEPPETDSNAAVSRPDADIRAMFNQPPSDAMKVTPAARQPVPGMTNPVLPSERPQTAAQDQLKREQPQHMQSRAVEVPRFERPATVEPPKAEAPKIVEAPKSERPMTAEPPKAEPPKTAEIPRPAPVPGAFSQFADNTRRNDTFSASAGEPGSSAPQPQAVDSTDRYLDIEDLYEVLSLKSKRTDSIYLIEEYLKSLPDSLPDESRRDIICKIVAVSGFDYDLLMGDGVLRVKTLKEYAERFARKTDEYVAARQAELDELDQQILRVRKLIENRRELHKRQFFTIEAEAQRLKEILTFISG